MLTAGCGEKKNNTQSVNRAGYDVAKDKAKGMDDALNRCKLLLHCVMPFETVCEMRHHRNLARANNT